MEPKENTKNVEKYQIPLPESEESSSSEHPQIFYATALKKKARKPRWRDAGLLVSASLIHRRLKAGRFAKRISKSKTINYF